MDDREAVGFGEVLGILVNPDVHTIWRGTHETLQSFFQ